MQLSLDKFKKIQHTTRQLVDGRFCVTVGLIDYIIDVPTTDDATILTFYLQKVATPMTAAAATGEKIEAELMVYALSEGLSQLGPLEYLSFVKMLLKDVIVGGVKGQKAVDVWDAHFKGRQADIGLLVPYVIQHSGIADFFAGLISVISTLFPAQEPSAQSQTESGGSSGNSTALPQS